jgi:hypothetical protein
LQIQIQILTSIGASFSFVPPQSDILRLQHSKSQVAEKMSQLKRSENKESLEEVCV